jgi:enoyl-CoA hydratase/carnithine racemase
VDDNGVALLILNRPEAANARNQAMREELLQHYAWIADQDDVRVLVLTGAGDRAFCAGMDMKESARPETPADRRERLLAGRDIDVLAALPIPTIAAINGFALGGGAEMALACDIRVMSDEASLGLPELKHGLVPGGGGTQRLPRLIGTSRALAMILLSESVTGPQAVEAGLAVASVPRADLRTHALHLATLIASRPAEAVRRAKELVRTSLDTPLAVGLEREFEALLTLLESRDGAGRDPETARVPR